MSQVSTQGYPPLLRDLPMEVFALAFSFLEQSDIQNLKHSSPDPFRKITKYCMETFAFFMQMGIMKSEAPFARVFQKRISILTNERRPVFITVCRLFKLTSRMLCLYEPHTVVFSTQSLYEATNRRYQHALLSFEKVCTGIALPPTDSLLHRDQRAYSVLANLTTEQKIHALQKFCTIGDPLPIIPLLERLPNLDIYSFGPSGLVSSASTSIIKGHMDLFETLSKDPRFAKLHTDTLCHLLRLSSQYNRVEAVRILVKHPHFQAIPATRLNGLTQTMWHAARRGHNEILRLLALHREYNNVPVNDDAGASLASCVVGAAEYGHFSTLEILAEHPGYLNVKANAEIDINSLARAIWAATKNGHKRCVYFLIRNPNYAEISEVKWNCLIDIFLAAIQAKDLELFMLFTEHPKYLKIYPFGWLSLARVVNEAASQGQDQMLEILTQHPRFGEILVERGHLCLVDSLKEARKKGNARCSEILQRYCPTLQSVTSSEN